MYKREVGHENMEPFWMWILQQKQATLPKLLFYLSMIIKTDKNNLIYHAFLCCPVLPPPASTTTLLKLIITSTKNKCYHHHIKAKQKSANSAVSFP